jgi:acetyl esterase/lipase
VASAEYRTTANSRFPAQIEDIKTAIRYLRKHSDQLRIDTSRITIMGGSAGAYLAAMVALTGGTDQFRGSDYLEYPDSVSSTICLYGLYDFLSYRDAIEKKDDSVLPLRLFLPKTDEQTLATASPVSYVKGCTVPFLLLHGTQDTLVSVDQSIELHNMLERAGSHVELFLFENAGHADTVFSQVAVQDIVLKFLNKSWR